MPQALDHAAAAAGRALFDRRYRGARNWEDAHPDEQRLFGQDGLAAVAAYRQAERDGANLTSGREA